MSPKKRFLSALCGGRVDRTPVIALSNWCVELQQATGAKFPDAQTKPEAMAKLQAGRYEIWGVDLLISHNDVLTEVSMLDAPIDIGTEDRQPSVLKNPLTGIDPREYDLPNDVLEHGRNPLVDNCAGILVKQYGDILPVFRMMAGPMLTAGHAWGVDNLCKWINTDPDKFEAAIRVCTDLWIETARNSIDTYAVHGTYTTDATASGDLINRETFEEFLLPEYKRFMKATKDVPSFIHICGNTRPYVDLLPNSGFDGFSFEGPGISVKEVKNAVGSRMSLIGNLPTLSVMVEGTPEYIKSEAVKAIADGVDILCPACGTPPHTTNEQMIALVESVKPREFRRKKVTNTKGDIIKKHLPENRFYTEVTNAVISGDSARTEELVASLLEKNEDPQKIITEAILPGVIAISELYDAGIVYIPELLLTAEAMTTGVDKCSENASIATDDSSYKILMHVADGDVHEIGKNIVKSILQARGYKTIDLGKSVSPEKVIEGILQEKPDVISGTSLMTSTRNAFPKIATLMKEKGIDIPFIIAGCAVDEGFAESMEYAIYCEGPEDANPIFEGLAEGRRWQEIRDEVHNKYRI